MKYGINIVLNCVSGTFFAIINIYVIIIQTRIATLAALGVKEQGYLM
jgi:hypothetical protein